MSGLGPDARALIEASRGEDEPSADDRARVGRKLADQLPAFAASAGLAKFELDAAHAAGQGKAAASASGLLGSGLAKVASLSVAALLAGSAAVVVMRDRAQPEVSAAQPASPAPLGIEQAAPLPSAPPSAVVQVAPRAADAQRRAVSQPRPRRALPSERAPAHRQRVATAAEREPVEEENPIEAAPPIETPRPDVRAYDVPANDVPALPKVEKIAAVAEPRRAEVRRGPDPEAVLLAAARAAFEEGEPERALELTQRHAARFPRSTLGEERVALQGLALCALHRFDEGLSVLRAARAAHSPLHAAALRACKVASRGQ